MHIWDLRLYAIFGLTDFPTPDCPDVESSRGINDPQRVVWILPSRKHPATATGKVARLLALSIRAPNHLARRKSNPTSSTLPRRKLDKSWELRHHAAFAAFTSQARADTRVCNSTVFH